MQKKQKRDGLEIREWKKWERERKREEQIVEIFVKKKKIKSQEEEEEKNPLNELFIVIGSFSFNRLSCFHFLFCQRVYCCNIIAIETDFIAWEYAQHT